MFNGLGKKLGGIFRAESLPGQTLREITAEYHIPELVRLPACGAKQLLHHIVTPTGEQSLHIERTETGFTLGIDIKGIQARPALAIYFQRVANDRYILNEVTGHLKEDNKLVMPMYKVTPSYDAVGRTVALEYIARNGLPSLKSKL